MNDAQFTQQGSKLTVRRAFDAPVKLVWRAWTEPDLLDQWWAPQPWKSETKSMDFRAGGSRLYAMVGPEGEKHWGLTEYESVNPIDSFSGKDSFADEEGKVNPDFPVATFVNQFIDQAEKTEVVIETNYASEEHLKQVIEMGMQEGLKAAFAILEEALKNLEEA